MNAWHLYRNYLLQISICVLPFAVLYWLLPFAGTLSIGNDYPVYSIQQQMELQYSLAHGTFPLYAPGFAGGRSSAALTLGQMFHPLAHLAAHSPGYWDGYALEWNTFWRLLSLGLTQLVLFNLLRRLRLRTDVSFILSYVTVYNQRMLDMFRYGASLESYTGFLLLCAAMTYLYVAPDNFIRPISVIGATYLLVCGGHPQIAYLGLLGAALVCVIIPGAVAAIDPDIQKTWRDIIQYYASVAAYVGLGLLCAAAYIVPFYFEFLRDAPARLKQPYGWSLAFSDHWGGALNSFFNPLRSDVHSAFGSSSLILLAALAPPIIAPFFKLCGRAIIISMWILSVFIFLCSIGSDTPFYHWFWKLVPLADSFRTPGRIAIILPPLLMFILAWFFSFADAEAPTGQESSMLPWYIAVSSLVVFVIGYVLLAHPETGGYTPLQIHSYPSWVNGLICSCGIVSLLLLMVRLSPLRTVAPVGLALSMFVVLQTVVQLRYGTWIDARESTPSIEQIDAQKRTSLAFRGKNGYGMESGTPAESSGAEVARSPSFTDRYPSYRPEFPMAVFRTDGSAAPASDYRPPSPQNPVGPAVPVTTLFTTVNRVVLKIDPHAPGFLSLTVPYSPQWHAVGGAQELEVRPTDHNELAIFVPSAADEVDLRFRSRASSAGMLISCAALLFVVIYFGRNCKAGWLRNSVMIIAIIVVVGGFACWSHSLYGGDDLGMQFKSTPSSW
jgi:hypothetical protein